MDADPLRQFEAEHREALAALDRLERAGEQLDRGANPTEPLAAVRDVATFLTTAVRRHNDNEERALFPVLGADAPIAVFEDEHHQLRQLERRLDSALQHPDAATRVSPLAREIVALLRGHIEREDQVLFPMARAYLGEAGLAQVRARLGE